MIHLDNTDLCLGQYYENFIIGWWSWLTLSWISVSFVLSVSLLTRRMSVPLSVFSNKKRLRGSFIVAGFVLYPAQTINRDNRSDKGNRYSLWRWWKLFNKSPEQIWALPLSVSDICGPRRQVQRSDIRWRYSPAFLSASASNFILGLLFSPPTCNADCNSL